MIKQKHLASTLARYFRKFALVLFLSYINIYQSALAQEEIKSKTEQINFPAAVIDMKVVLSKSSAFTTLQKEIQKVEKDYKEEIQNALASFTGKICQIPPNFSAIKIAGERSYNLARKNILVKHKPRQIEVYEFNLRKIINIDTAEFEVTSGKGTYIRALARDLAEKLNTKGHVIKLRRHFVGNFNEKDKIFIDFSEEIIHSPSLLKKIIPIEKVLDDIPALFLTETEAIKLKQGQKIRLNSFKFHKNFITDYPNYQKFERIFTLSNKKLIAVIEIDDGLVKPKRIINY